MLSPIIERIKGVLFHPAETFAETIRNDTLKNTLIYLLILVAIFSILAGVIMLVGVSDYAGGLVVGSLSIIAIIPLLFFAGLVGTIISAVYMHIWVYIVGGREGITETWKAVIYAATPSLLLGWIPVIGFVVGIWSLVLTIIGIRELQQISTGKAVLAVIIGIIIGILVFGLLGVALVGSMFAAILMVS